MSLERANPRRSKKSKKGCQTCKIRHVKCDETRPACKKCTGTGRTCDYLQQPQVPVVAGNRGSSYEHFLNPIAFDLALSAWVLPDPTWSNGRGLPWSSHDARSVLFFDYFREVCCAEIQGYFSSRLWGFIFLQVAHAEPAIRFAVLALSAMHYSQFSCKEAQSQSTWRQHAMIHFTNAVRELNGKLDGSLNSHKLALVASLIFTYYELLSGEETTSLQHLRGGANILSSMSDKPRGPSESLKLQAPQSHSSGISPLPLPDLMTPQPQTLKQDPAAIPSDVDLSELASAFARAIIEVSCYGVRYRFAPLAVPTLPTSFSSLAGPSGARYHLDLIVSYMYTTMDFRIEPSRTLPTEMLSEQISFYKQTVLSLLHQWNALFHQYQTTIPHESSFKDRTISLILTVQSRLAYLKLITHFFEDESIYDHYTDEFSRIIQLCEQVLASSTSTIVLLSTSTPSSSSPKGSNSNSNSNTHSSSDLHSASPSPSPASAFKTQQRPSIRFTTDSAIVHPLFFITLKCRSPTLRRRALALLAQAGREAAHDGHKLAVAANWVMEREEAVSAAFTQTVGQIQEGEPEQIQTQNQNQRWERQGELLGGATFSAGLAERLTVPAIALTTAPAIAHTATSAAAPVEPALTTAAAATATATTLPQGSNQNEDEAAVKLPARIRTLALRFCPDGESVQILCARKSEGNFLEAKGEWMYFAGLAWFDGVKRPMSGEQEKVLEREVERFREWHGSVR